ncbi:MAG: VWA domain-containing protein [Cyanobacteria bacterium SBLK]|nr:VWA domain-containing protein [Cyanobacteria bacterium SBLK]
MSRRLPVYLLLDCSGSMSGEPIEAVRQGLKALLSELQGDPMALETAYLSVITFDSTAYQVSPLTDLMLFQEPRIQASGSTSLGAALNLLEQCIDREVRKSSDIQKGDWKPLIFLMTDGMPTDRWEKAADRIKRKRPGNIIACAAGSNADENTLKRITEIVVKLNNLQPDTLKAFFQWVSSSIKTTSQSVVQVMADAPVNLPPPPPQIAIVP